MPHLKQLLLCSVLLFMLAAVAAFTQEAKNALLIANGEYGRNMGALGGEQRPFWYGALFSDISLTGFDR